MRRELHRLLVLLAPRRPVSFICRASSPRSARSDDSSGIDEQRLVEQLPSPSCICAEAGVAPARAAACRRRLGVLLHQRLERADAPSSARPAPGRRGPAGRGPRGPRATAPASGSRPGPAGRARPSLRARRAPSAEARRAAGRRGCARTGASAFFTPRRGWRGRRRSSWPASALLLSHDWRAAAPPRRRCSFIVVLQLGHLLLAVLHLLRRTGRGRATRCPPASPCGPPSAGPSS